MIDEEVKFMKQSTAMKYLDIKTYNTWNKIKKALPVYKLPGTKNSVRYKKEDIDLYMELLNSGGDIYDNPIT